MTIETITVPIYSVKFSAITCDRLEELREAYPDYDFYGSLNDYNGIVFESEGELVIAFEGYPRPGVIAHEAKHLVNQIFLKIGHNPDLFNDEPEAYLLGWIVDKLHEVIAISSPLNNTAEIFFTAITNNLNIRKYD